MPMDGNERETFGHLRARVEALEGRLNGRTASRVSWAQVLLTVGASLVVGVSSVVATLIATK